MKKHPLIFLFFFFLLVSLKAKAQDEKHKHYRFVYVENFPSAKHVIFGISDDGKKYEEVKVDRATSSSGTDFNETIKLIQKYQNEGWTLTRTQHVDTYRVYLIFEK